MDSLNNSETVEKFIELRPVYQILGNKVSNLIEEILRINSINFHVVTYRTKDVESFSKKIENPKYTDPFNQITDLSGIRVITYVEDDIIKVRRLIEDSFTIDSENSIDKGYDLGEDRVGYKSVHYICELPENRTSLPEFSRFKKLKFEVQIRTILQHSWAEVEHDRNYKFSGELPKEIKRRFKLLAGTLELVDREFNQLSKEIDNYAKNVKEKTKKGDLNIPIDSTSLREYLVTKFISPKIIQDEIHPVYEKRLIEELYSFGIKTIDELNKCIPKNYIKAIENSFENPENLLGITRMVMFISDFKKYFEKSFQKDWGGINKNHKNILRYYGINVDDFLSELNTALHANNEV